MKKKILALLFLPYLFFMFLESCLNGYPRCEREENRNITQIKVSHVFRTDNSDESIYIDSEYESYYVSNFNIDIIPKTYALDYEPNPCFEGFSNPIERISIVSDSDFDSEFLAGKELNSLFRHNNDNGSYENLSNLDENPFFDYSYVNKNFIIYNDSIPSLDSIHTLYFETYLADGKTYRDTLPNVNLNRTNNFYSF